ncbi:UNVERIFIED_CONTAM: DNA-binding transcriptional MerR regulator [Lysinibacillus xylanilyticus]
MELMFIEKFAKRVGVNVVTLRRMETKGENVSSGGMRYYSVEQLKQFGFAPDTQKLVIGYYLVSTPSQKIIRSKETKRLIDEVKNNDIGDKNKTKTN